MTRTRLAIGFATALVAAAALLLGGLVGDAPAPAPAVAAPEAATSALLEGFSTGDTVALMRSLERRVEARRDDATALVLLGLAYQQRARETGDASFYPRSQEAVERALATGRERGRALAGLAALAASRHDFRRARTLAESARRLLPRTAFVYGPLGDALVELGRYRQGFAVFDRMVELKPNLASYARIAYARELLGRPEEAIEALQLAIDAGIGLPEPQAWVLVQLGNLYFNTGRLAPASRSYREALARVPGYVYAEAGLARVEAARGHTERAVALYERVLRRVPLPEFAARLSETLHAARLDARAARADALVDTLGRLLRANGVRTDLETALFDLDRDRHLADALERARRAFRSAPSIHAEDVLSWALYKNGHCREARAHSLRALRLGTRDALLYFHRGMIERCVGNRLAARTFLAEALSLNPYFSPLHARTARELLR